MPTEDGPARPCSRAREVTRLPDRGTVLVRSTAPPRLDDTRCVDVRPGPFATFDGERLWLSLSVSAGDERLRFDRRELPRVEDAVVDALRERGSAIGGGRPGTDRASDTADGGPRAVLRFGDRAACRRMLPAPAADAIERRLGAAASRGAAAMLTWTSGEPGPGDVERYDVVLDPPGCSD